MSFFPRVLIDIQSIPYKFASDDVEITDGTNNIFYDRRVLDIESISVTEEISDVYWGIPTNSFPNIKLNNTDGFFNILDSTSDLRGKIITVKVYDENEEDPLKQIKFWFSGNISEINLLETAEIIVDSKKLDSLQTKLPKKLYEITDCTVVDPYIINPPMDLGKAYCLPFGHAKKVPLRYVHADYTLDQYDYRICQGEIESVDAVYRDGVLVDPSEYEVFLGNQIGGDHEGYAFIRFNLEQMSFSFGSMYNITANVKGLKINNTVAERNFVRVIQGILSNPVWGLGQEINEESFNEAANLVSDLKCDGHIAEQKSAQDILNNLLMCCRGTLYRDVNGKWGISIDYEKEINDSNIKAFFGSGDGYLENIISVDEIKKTSSLNTIKSIQVKYYYNTWKWIEEEFSPSAEYDLSIIRSTDFTDFGEEIIYELPFVYDSTTADKIAAYIQNRAIYSDKKLKITVGMEGKNLNIRDLVKVTIPRFNIDSVYQIYGIERRVTSNVLFLMSYSENIFDYVMGTLPDYPSEYDTIDLSKTPPIAPTNFLIDSTSIETSIEGHTFGIFTLKADKGDNYTYKIKFGYRKHTEEIYTYIYGTTTDNFTWKVRIPNLLCGLAYDFIAIAENSVGLESSGNPTILNIIIAGDTDPPDVPTGLNLSVDGWTIKATVNPQEEEDFGGFEFYADTTSNFVPDSSNLKGKGNSNTCVFIGSEDLQTWYVKARAYDLSKNYSAFCEEVSIATESSPLADTEEPDTPTGLSLSTGISLGSDGSEYAWIRATWNANTEPDIGMYECRIKEINGNYIYMLTGTNSQLFSPVRANVLHYVGVRAIDKWGNKSTWTLDSSITSASDTTPPNIITNFSASATFSSIILTWDLPEDKDIAYIEIFRNTVNNRATATSIAKVKGTFYVDRIGSYGQTRYYWAKTYDNSGNGSTIEAGSVYATTTYVQTTDINSFAITASKLFVKVPILQQDYWYSNNPSSGYVAWNNHYLYYNGNSYNISSGNTNNKYIYWQFGNSYYSSSNTLPILNDDSFLIATNVNGYYDLAWNAIANQVIGSAYIADGAIQTAHIEDAAITNAKIASLNAEKITAGDISAARMSLNAASAINSGSTLISSGKIQISGATTLSDWKKGGDDTKIDGAKISSGTISANALVVGSRNISIQGIEIKANYPSANTLYWTSGVISYINDSGNAVDITISSGGSAVYTGGTLYLYWTKDNSYLSTTYTVSTAFGVNNIVLASYRGGKDLVVNYGRTIIDGEHIITGSITSNQLSTGTLITNSAQIDNGIITNAHISSLDASKITSGYISTDRIQAGSIETGKLIISPRLRNLVVDGNFELGDLSKEWTNYDTSYMYASTNAARSGKYGLLLQGGKGSDYWIFPKGDFSYWAGYIPLFPVQVGETYYGEYYFKSSSGTYSQANFPIALFDNNKNQIGWGWIGTGTPATTTWQKISGTYTVTSDVHFICPAILFNNFSGANIYVDDYTFYQQVATDFVQDNAITHLGVDSRIEIPYYKNTDILLNTTYVTTTATNQIAILIGSVNIKNYDSYTRAFRGWFSWSGGGGSGTFYHHVHVPPTSYCSFVVIDFITLTSIANYIIYFKLFSSDCNSADITPSSLISILRKGK